MELCKNNKQNLRKYLKKARAEITQIMILNELELNNVYNNLQNNLFKLIDQICKSSLNNKTIKNIGVYFPINDEVDILSIIYGSKIIKENIFNLYLNKNEYSSGSKIIRCGKLSLDNNLNVHLKQDLKIHLPNINKTTGSLNFFENNFKFVIGEFNIPEIDTSTEKNKIIPDLVITPLLGFDSKSMNRIGYGKGCYDKAFLSYKKNYNFNPVKIGIVYDDCEIINALKYLNLTSNNNIFSEFDVPLDYIVTEKTIYSKNNI
jgi:5,10-methenyltetrahydrofolate synthetase